MSDSGWLAERFQENRSHLLAVAYRMLGSLSEAEDAVQETWLRLSRSDAAAIENLSAWLTTVVSRVCLDVLRSRASKREEPLQEFETGSNEQNKAAANPEKEALMADSVGYALLVILDRLSPAERIAFVLHDVFGLSFEDIGKVLGRSTIAARQLASRARRRVQGHTNLDARERDQQRRTVEAFLEALQRGDLERVVEILDPDLTVHIDETAARATAPTEIHGARNFAKGAVAFLHLAALTRPALIDGQAGLVFAPNGKLDRVLKFSFEGDKIAEIEIIANADRLRAMELALLNPRE